MTEAQFQPELSQDTVEKKEPIENEFAPDPTDELEEDAPRIGRMNDLMQGVARQASLDPARDTTTSSPRQGDASTRGRSCDRKFPRMSTRPQEGLVAR